MLTAAHCIESGFRVPRPGCMVDADCPDLGEYENVISLQCDPLSAQCVATDDDYSNATRYALFGETYPGRLTDGHTRKAVPIAYCHQKPDDTPDFAYCVLTDEPNVQPAQVMMHCEADLYLPDDVPVLGVGFGNSAGGVGAGIKRSATVERAEHSHRCRQHRAGRQRQRLLPGLRPGRELGFRTGEVRRCL